MMYPKLSVASLLFFLLWAGPLVKAQSPSFRLPQLTQSEPWTPSQLMEPAYLVKLLSTKTRPELIILNIGVVENIQGAVSLGAASQAENLAGLRAYLKKLPSRTLVVLYCGCCPFKRCPNIRPAMALAKSMGFIHARLLNLPTNLQTDWIAKNYPVEKAH